MQDSQPYTFMLATPVPIPPPPLRSGSHLALSSFMLEPSAVMCSAKVRRLATLLPTLRQAGSRVLLFSQWTSMLDVIEWFLQQHDWTYVRLDGSTQVST